MKQIMNYKLFRVYSISIIICYLLAVLLLYFNTNAYFPDFLKLRNNPKIENLLLTLIGANASAIGIFISVVIISFSLMNTSIRYYTIEYLSEKRSILILGNLFFLSTLTSILSYIFVINKFNFAVNFTYFSIILFIIYIASLIPISLSILNSSISLEESKIIVNRILHSDIIDILNPIPDIPTEYQLQAYGRNPIFIAREIAVNAIKSNDWILPQFLINLTIKKIHLVINPKENAFINTGKEYSALLEIFLQRIFNTAVELKASSTISACINSINLQIKELFKDKVEIQFYENLFLYITKIYISIVEKELQVNYADVFNSHRIIIEDFHLSGNIPDEHNIPIFNYYYKTKINENRQFNRNWEIFNDLIFTNINAISLVCFSKKDQKLFDKSISHVKSIFNIIEESTVLSENQKDFLLTRISTEVISITNKAYKANLVTSLYLVDFFSRIEIYHYINNAKSYGKKILIHYGNAILTWSKNNWIEPYSLSNLISIARMCLLKANTNKLSLDGIYFILIILKELQKYYKANKMYDHSLYIYEEILILQKLITESKVVSKKLQDIIDIVLKKSKNLNKIKKKSISNRVKWE